MSKVITFGVFDYFHLGHLRLFKNCRKYGDYLIVAVQDENFIKQFKPDAKVLYSTEERIEMIKSLRMVDEVVVYDIISPEFLSKIDFDILALGEDQTADRFINTANWCLENEKKVVHMKRTEGICSSEIKRGM
jgi:glycerol-3-phosphate cytidylyltransferase